MLSSLSLRYRLTAILCLLVAFLGLLCTLATFLLARELASQFNTSLSSLAIREDRDASNAELAGAHNPAQLILQVWDNNGGTRPIKTTDPSISLPRTPLGFSTVKIGNESWDVFSVQAEISYVQFGELQSVRRRNARRLALGSLLLTLLLLPLLALVVSIVVRAALRPLSRMGELAAKVDLNNLSALDATGAPEELRPFLRSINGMIEKISVLLNGEKKFIANAAHELRTPISALQLQLDALKNARDEERQERIEDLQRGISRTGSLVSQLLGLARAEMGRSRAEYVPIFLPDLVSEVVADLLPLALHRGADVGVVHLAPLTLFALEADLRIMLKNLIDNAIRYGIGADGQARVDVNVLHEANMAIIEVLDEGPGLTEAQLKRVFERFFRGKSEEVGSGLGLSIVAATAAAYDGRVSLANRVDGKNGIVARIEMPLPVHTSQNKDNKRIKRD